MCKRRATRCRELSRVHQAAGRRRAPGGPHGLGSPKHLRRRRAAAPQWAPRTGRTAAAVRGASTRTETERAAEWRALAANSDRRTEPALRARQDLHHDAKHDVSINRCRSDRFLAEDSRHGVTWTGQSAACAPRPRHQRGRPFPRSSGRASVTSHPRLRSAPLLQIARQMPQAAQACSGGG
jgi:hypothetical protein